MRESEKAKFPVKREELVKEETKSSTIPIDVEAEVDYQAAGDRSNHAKPSPRIKAIPLGSRLLEAAEKTKIKEIEENFALPPSLKLGEPVAVEFRLTV